MRRQLIAGVGDAGEIEVPFGAVGRASRAAPRRASASCTFSRAVSQGSRQGA